MMQQSSIAQGQTLFIASPVSHKFTLLVEIGAVLGVGGRLSLCEVNAHLESPVSIAMASTLLQT